MTKSMFSLPKKWGRAAERLSRIQTTDGGPGSGNWGHKGRPGLVGGSGKGGGSQYRGGRSDIAYVSSRRDWLNGLSGERQKKATKFMETMRVVLGVQKGQPVDQAVMKSEVARAPKLKKEMLEYMAEARNWEKNAKRMIEQNLDEKGKAFIAHLNSKYGQVKSGGVEIPDDSDDNAWDCEDLERWQDLKSKAMGGPTSGKEIPDPAKFQSTKGDSSHWSDATKDLVNKKMALYGEGVTDPDEFVANLVNEKTSKYNTRDVLKAIGDDLGWQQIGNSREFENLTEQESKDLSFIMDQFPWVDGDPKYAHVFSDERIMDETSSKIRGYYLALKAKALGLKGIKSPSERPEQLAKVIDDPEALDPLARTQAREHAVTEAGNVHREAAKRAIENNANLFSGAPEGTKEQILKSIDTMDDGAAELVSKTIGNLSIVWGTGSGEVSHYTQGSGTITLDTDPDNTRGVETFWHEFGHYLDDSTSSESGMNFWTYPLHSDYAYEHRGITSLAENNEALNRAAKSDMEALIKRFGLSDFTVHEAGSAHGGRVIIKYKDQWVDPMNPLQFEVQQQLSEALNNTLKEWAGTRKADNYMKEHGEPQRPVWDDYFETYTTPKRHIIRHRERFKGAEAKYHEDSEKYWQDHEAWEKNLGPEKLNQMWDEVRALRDESERKMRLAGSVTDSIDDACCGQFLACILLGGHDPKYYRTRPRLETTANMFQMIAMGDPDQIDCVKTFLPATYELYTKALRFKGQKKPENTFDSAIDGGPGSGNFGHSGRPGMVGGSGGGGSGQLDKAWTPSGNYEPAETRREFVQKNVKALKANGATAKDLQDEYESTMMQRAVKSARPTTKEEAIAAAREGIPDSWRRGWFVEYNSEYKPKIEERILANPETLNAGWNIAYSNFMETVGGGSGMSFEQFLSTPIRMYRGTNGQKEIASDVWSSFSMDRKVAEKFGGNVETITIRPIDTWGSFQTTGEAEVLVPRKMLRKLRGEIHG